MEGGEEMAEKEKGWRYVHTLVTVHFFIWGFVALNRNVINFLFPKIVEDLKMSYTEAGALVGILGVTWAFASLFIGGFSDKYGRKKMLAPCIALGSIFSFASGLVTSFVGMAIMRGLLGVPGGGYYPTGVATIAEESPPESRGLTLGVHQSAFAVFGVLLAPIWAVTFASVLGWRWALYLTIIPGAIMLALYSGLIKEPQSTSLRKEAGKKGEKFEIRDEHGRVLTWKDVFKHRNVVLGCIISILIMTWLFPFIAFSSLFLTKVRGFEFISSGTIMSFFGLGGAISYVSAGYVSDHLGRKTTLLIYSIGAGIATILFMALPLSSGLAYLLTFLSGLFGFGLFVISVAIVPAESVPFNMAGLAVGIVIFIGEIFGTGMLTFLCGIIADAFGLGNAILVAGISVLVVFLVGLGLKETAPRVLAKRLGTQRSPA
jgi:MFS family permease